MTRTTHSPSLMLLNTSPRLPLIAVVAVRFAAVVTRWEQRRRSRINLGRLDDRLLKDVGLTPDQARRETQMHFWQI